MHIEHIWVQDDWRSTIWGVLICVWLTGMNFIVWPRGPWPLGGKRKRQIRLSSYYHGIKVSLIVKM